MRRILLTLLIAISSVLAVHAQGDETGGATVVRAEYFFDTDPGYGNATIINNVTSGDNNLSLSVDGLSPGAHVMYVRSQASNGVWSATQAHPLLLIKQKPSQATRVEYFYDTDPGYGMGKSVGNLTEGDNNIVVSVAGLPYGVHHLCFRAQDDQGIWSQVATYSVFVTSPKTANAVRIEYFFDNDPGFGMGTSIGVAQDEEATYALPLDGLSMGAHMLYLRVQDNHGRWSSVQSHPIYVLNNLPDVVAVEYFFDDNDPGEGQATAVPLPGIKTDPFAFEANTAGLSAGEHHLKVRLLKNNGFWTLFDAATFTVEGLAEPEPYAVLTDNTDEVSTTSGTHSGKTLTFYYDDQKTARNGMGVGPFSSTSSVAWYNNSDVISRAVFDDSFAGCTTLTSTAYWFAQCRNLRTITGMSNLKTDNVTNMASMFDVCESLTELDLTGFNTSKVTSMERMFLWCSELTSLDLSSFNTANVKNMDLMFYHMFKVISIYAGDEWDVSNVTASDQMFGSCKALVGGASTQYSDDKEGHTYAHIDGGPDNPGYFTVKGTPVPYAAKTVNADSDESHDRYTLTFYYDTNIVERGGMGIGVFTEYDKKSWYSDARYITAAAFDESFADYTNLLSTAHWFSYCENLASVTGTENLKTDNLVVMTDMFYGCQTLKEIDLTGINTSNVLYMSEMFGNCYSLTSLDLSNFNTANVKNMNSMFYSCQSLTTIYAGASWSTASVEDGDYMFYGCSELVGGAGTKYHYSHTGLDYAHIDGGTTNPGYFTDKNAPGEPEPYAVLSDNGEFLWMDGDDIVYGKTLTFYYDDQKATRNGMSVGPFSGYPDDYPAWHAQRDSITKAVFDPSFANCTSITSTAYWFLACENMTSIVGISNLKTDNVTDMRWMFYGCSKLTSLDVSGFKTDNVTDMSGMFSGCYGLTSLDVSGFKTDNVTNMEGMFTYSYGLTSLDVSNFKTDNVTDMHNMFGNCSGLTSLDLSNFKTDNVTLMTHMFEGCSNLTSLDLSNFKTDKLMSMLYMFADCSGLTNLDLSGFNTASVTEMRYMFSGCSELKTIYAGSEWSTAAVTEDSEMFEGCEKLVGGMGTVFDANHTNSEYARIDGGPTSETPGYFTDKNATPVIAEAYAVLSDDNTVLTFYYDGQKSARNGLDLGPFSYPDYQSWSGQSRKITNVVFDASFADYAELSNTSYWFRNCANLTTITGIENLNTLNVEDMSSMFDGCAKLTGLDVSHFNTSKVTSFWGTFFGCRSLTSLDLSGFSTENVEYVNYMFDGCAGLTSLDLSSFSTPQLKYMYNMFDGCSNLMTIDMRNFTTARVTSMDDLFAGCTSLVAIHAGGANIPDSLYAGIGNPNLLVYVNDASVAPTSIQNVVVNGVAKEIVLTDEVGTNGNNNFFVPQSFTAEKVSYTRNFTQQTQPNVSRGWESISLPFSVQNIVHETKGDLSPFGSPAEGKRFWLRRLADNGLTRASQIEANVPYVISMPNSTEYTDLYNLAGRVTFSSQYTTVPATTQQILSLADSSIVMMPTTLRVNRSSSVWAINVGEVRGQYLEGSVFERDYREVRPFEAYTVHRSNGPAPRFVPIIEMDADATGIEDVRGLMSDGRGDQWYDVNGRKLQQKPTKKGIYILNGIKVVIK